MCASDMKIVFYDSHILLFRSLEEIKYFSGLFYYLERAVRFQKSLLWTETTCPGFFVSHDGHTSEYQMIHQIVGYSSSGRKRKGKHNPSIFFFLSIQHQKALLIQLLNFIKHDINKIDQSNLYCLNTTKIQDTTNRVICP